VVTTGEDQELYTAMYDIYDLRANMQCIFKRYRR
jgi:hypothetical protein